MQCSKLLGLIPRSSHTEQQFHPYLQDSISGRLPIQNLHGVYRPSHGRTAKCISNSGFDFWSHFQKASPRGTSVQRKQPSNIHSWQTNTTWGDAMLLLQPPHHRQRWVNGQNKWIMHTHNSDFRLLGASRLPVSTGKSGFCSLFLKSLYCLFTYEKVSL